MRREKVKERRRGRGHEQIKIAYMNINRRIVTIQIVLEEVRYYIVVVVEL